MNHLDGFKVNRFTQRSESFMNRTSLIRRYKTQNKRENTNNCTCNRALDKAPVKIIKNQVANSANRLKEVCC